MLSAITFRRIEILTKNVRRAMHDAIHAYRVRRAIRHVSFLREFIAELPAAELCALEDEREASQARQRLIRRNAALKMVEARHDLDEAQRGLARLGGHP